MNTNKSSLMLSSLFLAITGLGCAVGAQAAADNGWYLGAGVGRSDARDLSGIDSTLAGYGITSRSSIDDSATAWKLFGGYQVNKHFGLEGGYADLGRYDINSSVTAPGAGPGAGNWEADNVWSLAAVGYLPIHDRFSAFGKAGLAYSRVNFTHSSPGAAVNASDNTTNPLFGLGLKYDFTKNASVRGEFERYQNLANASTTGETSVNVWSLGMQYLF